MACSAISYELHQVRNRNGIGGASGLFWAMHFD